jgi:hypothetical protein
VSPPNARSSDTYRPFATVVIITIFCGPSPFTAITSAAAAGGAPSRWINPGIQVVLLAVGIWAVNRHLRWPARSAARWDMGAYFVLAIINLAMGALSFHDGAPDYLARAGTPDWGYRLDAVIACMFGAILLALGVRELVRLRHQSAPDVRSDRSGSPPA